MATAERVLELARVELGTKEIPANSNRVKYNTWYYGREVSGTVYPWCMTFVQWIFSQAGVSLPVKTASCGALMNAAKRSGQWVTKGFRPGDVVIETVAREYLAPLLERGVDALILGCTHYPLLEEVIASACGPGVALVSAGEESAFELKRLLTARELRAPAEGRGGAEFCVSDRAEDFEGVASLFLQEDIHHMARRIDIDQY